MPNVILPNLPLVFFFVCCVVERFKKLHIHHLAMGSIVVYCTTIIPNTLNKVTDCIKLRVAKDWLI